MSTVVTGTNDIRCPVCGKLLARWLNGEAEIRRAGNQVAVISSGSLSCCGMSVSVGVKPTHPQRANIFTWPEPEQ